MSSTGISNNSTASTMALGKWLVHIQSPPKEATAEILSGYFSKFGKVLSIRFIKSQHIEAEEAQKKILKNNPRMKADLDLDNRMLNSALLECESESMKTTILKEMHFLGKKIVKVREYMTKAQLKAHIENIRLTRIFLDNIPHHVQNEDLKKFFTSFGPVKIAYTTLNGKGKKGNKPKTGYVIFKNDGVIEKLDPSGIKMGKNTLLWHSFYIKNKQNSVKLKKLTSSKMSKQARHSQ